MTLSIPKHDDSSNISRESAKTMIIPRIYQQNSFIPYEFVQISSSRALFVHCEVYTHFHTDNTVHNNPSNKSKTRSKQTQKATSISLFRQNSMIQHFNFGKVIVFIFDGIYNNPFRLRHHRSFFDPHSLSNDTFLQIKQVSPEPTRTANNCFLFSHAN